MSDWKADVYHRVSEPQRLWGEAVLADLELRGDETVLDAGCGTGRLTARLLERLPRGRVVALDASPAMLEVARQTLEPFGSRVTFVQAKLAEDPLPSGMEVVFSTATFHWVRDHDALFRDLSGALVPGGRLHAQCGGEGNLARAHEHIHAVITRDTYRPYLEGMPESWRFAGIVETKRRLTASGFVDLDVSLRDAPTSFAGAAEYAEFVGAVVLRPFLARLPAPLHQPFVADITALAGEATPRFLLDYVRLDIRCRRPETGRAG
jgi:trans-aconitate 2-methyltransferase